MEIKRNIRKTVELGGSATIIAILLAGCFGSGGSVTTAGSSGTPLVITPALGQVYRGHVTVTGNNNTSRSYTIVSGVPTVTADISGMTAPLLIALTGDPANGNQLVFFDEGLGTIASSVVSSSASAVRAIVPSVTGLSASGVGVTPLTEVAAATVANASGIVNISTLSAASAVGANTAGLALFRKLSGSTTIDDVLTPPTSVKALGATLGVTAGDTYAKVLHTLAKMPSAYGENAFKKASKLRDDIIATGTLSSTFDADVGKANIAVAAAGGYVGTAPVPTASNADFKAMMDIAARARPASAVSATEHKAAQLAMMDFAFNAASGVVSIDRNAPAFASAVAAAKTLAASTVAAMQASITAGAGASTGNVCVASIQGMASLTAACYTNLTPGFVCSQTDIQIAGGSMPAGGGTFAFSTAAACPSDTVITFDVSKFTKGVTGGGTTTGGTTGGTTNGLFQGSYSGSFSGEFAGTWSIAIDANGKVTGTATDSLGGVGIVAGAVTPTLGAGNSFSFTGTGGGTPWVGTLDISTGKFSGTWGGVTTNIYTGTKTAG